MAGCRRVSEVQLPSACMAPSTPPGVITSLTQSSGRSGSCDHIEVGRNVLAQSATMLIWGHDARLNFGLLVCSLEYMRSSLAMLCGWVALDLRREARRFVRGW